MFFKQPQFQGLLGDDFLQLPRLPAKVRDLAAGCCTRRIARQPVLAGLQELLGPAVIKALGDTLTGDLLGDFRAS